MRVPSSFMLTVLSALPIAAQTQRVPMFIKTGADSRIAVYADGNLKNALGNEGGAQLAAASLGLGIGISRYSFDLLVNTVGTAEPLTKGFGTTLLAPASGSSLAAGLLEVRSMPAKYLDGTKTFGMGWRGYASVSSARWQTDPAEDPTGVVVGGLGFGRFFSFLGQVAAAQNESANPVGAVLDIGVAARAIGGDIANTGNRDHLNAAIPGREKVHVGVELGLQLHINGAKASLTYYAFWGQDVPGLTRGQVVAGFSVQSALFQGTFSPRKQP